MKRIFLSSRKRQRGAAVVEFALIAIVFFMLLIGIVEMGRVLFTWNAAAEATRYGARVAVVCDPSDRAVIFDRMQKIMRTLEDRNLLVCYADNFTGAAGSGGCESTCTVSTCKQVSVSVRDIKLSPLIPTWVGNLVVPPFTTTLPRESMLNAIEDADGNPRENPVCSLT